MEVLDISVSGTKAAKPTPVCVVLDSDATHERIAKTPSEMVEGTRQFKDELLVRLADKGQLWPDATINAACHLVD
jgi:hypothetical protein